MIYSPANVDECAEVLAETARAKQHVTFVGGGTELGLGNPLRKVDATVRTERMTRILEYTPSDMVIIAEAGVTLAQLQKAAREHRQMLALDPPQAERATIGGVVATGAYGPRRARYGAIRDLIIGVTLVRADGVVARGGGKVVKNVAGFDLPKVACGSLGTLAMIGTATFRLHPLPESSATAVFSGLSSQEIIARMAAIREAQLEPSSAIALRNTDGTYDLGVRFEGFSNGVDQQLDRLGCAALSERDAAGFWKRHDAVREGDGLRVRVAALPSQLAAVDAAIAPLGGAFAWYATLGLGFVHVAFADELRAAREALVKLGGWLIVETAQGEVDAWGPPPNAFRIMEQLKNRFDPERRLNAGRFVGGL